MSIDIEHNDCIIVINYCIMYAKQHIYLGILNDKNKIQNFNIDFLACVSNPKNPLK